VAVKRRIAFLKVVASQPGAMPAIRPVVANVWRVWRASRGRNGVRANAGFHQLRSGSLVVVKRLVCIVEEHARGIAGNLVLPLQRFEGEAGEFQRAHHAGLRWSP